MKVKVRYVDEGESDLFYTARSVEIKPTSKTIKTPIRVLTNGDLNAKAGAPLEISLEAPIAGIHKPLNKNDVNGIFTKNNTSEKIIKWIEGFLQQMQHSKVVFPLIQPPKNSFDEILISDKVKRTFFRLIYQIQKQAGLDNICVPWLNFSKEKTIEFYDEILKNSNDNYIFFLNSESKPEDISVISNYLKQQIETERIQFVGILSKPVRKVLRSYDILWDTFKESDAGLILSDIERVDTNNPNIANVSSSHFNEFIVGDAFMSKVYGGGGGANVQFFVSHRLKIFNKDTLAVNPVERYPSDEEWISSITNTIFDPTLRNKLENYEEANSNRDKYNVLNYIAKVHEFIESSDEFRISQDYIKKEESSVYISEKQSLNSAILNSKRKN